MGGVSQGRLSVDTVEDEPCLCLHGEFSLANNGGFVQASLYLGASEVLDAGAYRGFELAVCGDGGLSHALRPFSCLWSGFRVV